MTSGLLAALYALVLTTSFLASRMGPPVRRPRHWPWATTVALLVVGIPTLAQFTVAPWLLGSLQRDWTLIGRGQVWRLVTALVVQDGGLVGTVFNLVALVVIGVVAEQVWSCKRWTVIVVQPMGAGNSVVVFGLAASVAVLAVVRRAGVQRLVGLISLAGAAVLLVHGGAATIGALVGLAFSRASQDSGQVRSRPADHEND
jgi:hypothetical protein